MDQRSKIAILGFGAEGKAIFEYLKKHKYPNLTICDQNLDLKKEMPDGVSVRLGKDYLQNLTDFDVVFRSPGVKYLDPNIQYAIQKGVDVTSSTVFFIEHCPCKVIGVSGTKGKGTTCTLIYLMLKKSKKDVYLGGNIGDPSIGFLDKVKAKSFVVLELSSFQLQDLVKSPHYSVLLNTTSDHLDYHVDRDEYLEAKESILAHQNKESVAVLNKDYEYVKYYSPLVQGKLKYISTKTKIKDGAYALKVGSPRRRGRLKGEIIYAEKGKNEKIADIEEVALIGSHNLENILPAVIIAKEIGVPTKNIKDVIKSFKGLPNRLEFVREVKKKFAREARSRYKVGSPRRRGRLGVKFYNDSFATTPETSMAAVDSFDAPTVLIAGGYDKGADYNEWALKILIKPSLHTVVLMGANAEKLEGAILSAKNKLGDAEGSPTNILHAKNLEEAVEKGLKAAEVAAADEGGGVVVMSPACASFDMFKNYKERGEKFRKIVERL